MVRESLCGNLRNEGRSFKVGRLQSFVIWKCRLLKTKATIYQSTYWNPSCLFFSNLNQMRIKLIFAKQIEMKRKIPISSGKLHRKNKCIFSSFNMSYLSPPLFWFSIFFPLIVKACNPILLSGSHYLTHAASSAYFPSAIYKGGHRLSACWTVISSHSAGDEDAKIFFCSLWSSLLPGWRTWVSTRSTWIEPNRTVEAAPTLRAQQSVRNYI